MCLGFQGAPIRRLDVHVLAMIPFEEPDRLLRVLWIRETRSGNTSKRHHSVGHAAWEWSRPIVHSDATCERLLPSTPDVSGTLIVSDHSRTISREAHSTLLGGSVRGFEAARSGTILLKRPPTSLTPSGISQATLGGDPVAQGIQ